MSVPSDRSQGREVKAMLDRNNMLTTVQAVSLIPNLNKPDEEGKNEQSQKYIAPDGKAKTFSEILDEKCKEASSDISISTNGYNKKAISVRNVILMRDYTFATNKNAL